MVSSAHVSCLKISAGTISKRKEAIEACRRRKTNIVNLRSEDCGLLVFDYSRRILDLQWACLPNPPEWRIETSR